MIAHIAIMTMALIQTQIDEALRAIALKKQAGAIQSGGKVVCSPPSQFSGRAFHPPFFSRARNTRK
jgi:hypothetical protein